jgi:aryl-alcohol dehydrogenase-like predicted oxidoreductase
MEQITIGTPGLTTSRIGLGTWAIGGWMWGGTNEAQSIATIHAAVERGVTLIDTAPVYGFGRSEEIIGKALAKGVLRDKVQIATKVGLGWKDGKLYRDSRPARIRQEIEDSLHRLRTDVIDLYEVHWPDLETPFAETARTLEDLRREGKIRAIGVSNYSPAQMDAFRTVAKLDAVQSPYNLFEREIESDVLPYAERAGLVVLSYGALCRGLLTGKITAETSFKGDDLRRSDPKFQGARLPQYLAAVEELDKLARERFDKSVLALAVRWVLDQGPTIALWGARHPDQLAPIGDIDGWHVDQASKCDIDAILQRCIKNPVSPASWRLPPSGRDGHLIDEILAFNGRSTRWGSWSLHSSQALNTEGALPRDPAALPIARVIADRANCPSLTSFGGNPRHQVAFRRRLARQRRGCFDREVPPNDGVAQEARVAGGCRRLWFRGDLWIGGGV